mgnify:FL=1
MKRGIIVINAFDASPAYLYQSARLKEEFDLLGADVTIYKNDDFGLSTDENGIRLTFKDVDFAIYLDKDKYLLEALTLSGIKVFNTREAIENCDDKVLTYLALAKANIPTPATYPAPLCYKPDSTVPKAALYRIATELSFPIIVKESFGSLGKGVYLAKDEEELETLANRLIDRPHLFQKFVSTSYGKDVRVIVIGGEVVGGMIRQSENDFRSNVAAGGRAEKYGLSDGIKEIALKAHRALGLDYSGVDILFGENGKPIVCEVNSNAFFKSFEAVTHINVARKYAEYVLSKI